MHLIFLSKKIPSKLQLLLVGDGSMKPFLLELIHALSLEHVINVISAVNNDDVPALLNHASIFVLPSLKEGMPRALLETMACGTAVIGSNVSGIKDIIRHEQTGILVPPKDPVALSDAILKLLKDENLRRFLGKNAREEMVTKYNWATITDKLDKVYYEAVARAKSS